MSAKAAYQMNRKGFESAIARFKKVDPMVNAPAKELLALTGKCAFKKGVLPPKSLAEARAPTAKKELETRNRREQGRKYHHVQYST